MFIIYIISHLIEQYEVTVVVTVSDALKSGLFADKVT